MATSDFQETIPSKRFAQTITHWCNTKLGFREWLASQVAKYCRYVASRHKSEKKAYDKGKSDQFVLFEYPNPPFEGETLSLGAIATFAVDRFNRLNTKNKIVPKGLTGRAKHVWIAGQIHECDLPSHPNAEDLADQISSPKIKEFTSTLEDQFTRDALEDLFAAPRSNVDEVCAIANDMRVRASGEFAGVVAGALGNLRNWYYEAGGSAAIPPVPDSGTVFQDSVIEWLSDLIVACEPGNISAADGNFELRASARAGTKSPDESKEPNDDSCPLPSWNSELCELSLGDQCVRKIRRLAVDSCTILTAFEEEAWKNRILSPLSPERDLSNAVKALNSGLLMLRFERDGSGEGIVWRLAKSS
jgi:hypothetical protein